MLKKVRNFILEEEFAIHIYNNKVNIVNYTKVGHFDHNKVIIYYDNNQIIIHGEKLFVSKLLTDEILVEGKIKNIEFRWKDE